MQVCVITMVKVDSASTSALHIVLNRGAEVTLLKCKLRPRFHKNLRSPKWFSPCHFPSLLSSSPPSAMPAALFLHAQQAWLHLPVFALAASPAWNALPLFSSLAFAQKLSQGGLPWSPYWKTAEWFKPHPLFLLHSPGNNPHLTHYRLRWVIWLIAQRLSGINASGRQDFFFFLFFFTA